MKLPLTHYTAALVASTVLLHSSLTAAHSWLECTDYRMDPNSNDAKIWNADLCHGRARCGGEQMKVKFGTDTGFNQHDLQCQCKRGSEKDTAPVAKYTPGQRVCLAYPPKNHVAASCTNAFIPDSGVRITRTKVNPTSDDSFAMDYQHGNGEHANGQLDYKGFQNCPNFCEDMGGALCTMCFDLEKDITPGQYTFKWIWAFNTEEDVYTSCWEAQVGGDGATTGPGNGNGSGNQGNSNNNSNSTSGGPAASTPTSPPLTTPAPVSQVAPDAPSPSPTPTVAAGTTTPAATSGDEVGADADTGAGEYGNGNGDGHQAPHKQFESGQAQGGGNSGDENGYQPSHGSNPAGGGSHPGKSVDGKPENPGNSGNTENNKAPVDQKPSETNGDAEEEPDCDVKLSMPSDTPTLYPPPSPTPTADEAASGGADNGQEDPDCEQTLPYSYDTEAAEASQGSDCEDALSIADENSAPVTGGQAPGDKNYGGGAHGHGHEGGDQKPHSDSYSFKSAMGNPYREAENKNSEGAGVVLPYPGE